MADDGGWHVMLHQRPARTGPPETVTVRGQAAVTRLGRLEAEEQTAPFPKSFEEASAALETLPRLFLEPDGSFVWVGPGRVWFFNGQMTDHAGRLVHVELRGLGDRTHWTALAEAVSGPNPNVCVQLVTEAVYLDWETFLSLTDTFRAGEDVSS